MPMTVQILNAHVINVLEADMRALASDLAGQRNLRQAWERVRDEVNIPSIQQNFDRGGRPSRWEPLAPMTLARSPGRIGGPLQVTGQLERSATAKARFHIAHNEMTYGGWPPTRWFGPIHDFGAEHVGIPQRQFVMIQQPEDVQQIAEILMEWVEDRVNDNIKMRYV